MQHAIDAFKQAMPLFTDRITDGIMEAQIEGYTTFSRDQLAQAVERSLVALHADLSAGSNSNYADYWRAVGRARAQHANLDDILKVWDLSTAIMNNYFAELYADDSASRAWWFYHWQRIVLAGLMGLADVFVSVREEIIREQSSQLQQLSSPIIPVHSGILVLPLIGAIDSRRAGQIMASLLEAVNRHGAEVVIMDITGVPMVDTEVANHLVQSARAARLLGSEIVLVGASPEIAQTVVQLGVELQGITTRSDLQSGIAYALRMQGLSIQPVD